MQISSFSKYDIFKYLYSNRYNRNDQLVRVIVEKKRNNLALGFAITKKVFKGTVNKEEDLESTLYLCLCFHLH